MINRYQGNSGRVERFPESGEERRAPPREQIPRRQPPPPVRQRGQRRGLAPRPPVRRMTPGPAPGGVHNGLGDIGRLLPDKIGELETDDIILLLILYLMYRESGDSELLIIMGAMFLL